jgi:hypothetical protein
MAMTELNLDAHEIHPIDMVEMLATRRDWDFDRIAEDQIAMIVEGSWRTYSITLAWSEFDETLRMICSFELDPPKEKLSALYETLNLANDACWAGGFSFWKQQRLMVYRYGLILAGGAVASSDQLDQLLHTAVGACERYYPAYQLACWGDDTPSKAIDVAIGDAYGRA